jgi:GNAT superfamily N-acetyltransferase
MAFVIRLAEEEDTAAVAQCWFEAYYDDPGTADLGAEYLAHRTLGTFLPRAAQRIPDTLVVCAEGSGEVIGFCVAKEDEVEAFFLSKKARGIGISTALMGRAEALLLEQGTETAHLVVFAKNPRGIRFYERCGFEFCRECVHDVQISDGKTYPLTGLLWYEKKLK